MRVFCLEHRLFAQRRITILPTRGRVPGSSIGWRTHDAMPTINFGLNGTFLYNGQEIADIGTHSIWETVFTGKTA